jgi:pimeloyl-ACP methyl ester carboxylesterase
MQRSQVLIHSIIALLLIAVGPPSLPSSAEPSVEYDEAKRITRVIIPSVNNQVAWNDVLQGLTRAGNFDDTALRALLPDGQIDLTAAGSQLTIRALNLALAPDIQLSVLPASETRPEFALQVTLDKRKLANTRRNLKAWIRSAIEMSDKEDRSQRFGLELDEGWQAADPTKPLVVVLHGFNSAAREIAGLVSAVQAAKLPTGTFAYPNDQPIADSAQGLSRDLKKLAAGHPQRRLVLVTHSMGGLVARAALENAQLDPGNVAKLIMIAPPTHGSQWAHLSYGREVLELLFRSSKSSEVSQIYAAIENGLAEADYDLQPGSEFLRELNARPRNKQVQYSVFLGTAGPLTAEQLQSVEAQLDQLAGESKAIQLVHPHLKNILTDFDELLAGKGDGVVAVKRGRLEGVADTVLLNFTHLGPTGNTPTPADRKLYEAIRLRLKQQ